MEPTDFQWKVIVLVNTMANTMANTTASLFLPTDRASNVTESGRLIKEVFRLRVDPIQDRRVVRVAD